MPAFGRIPDIGKAAAAAPTAGMLPTSFTQRNIGADLAVPLSQSGRTRGLSPKGFGTLPQSFASGMQKGMQVGQQAAMEQARVAQIRQAEMREKVKQAEVIANQGIQQMTAIITNAPNRSPTLIKTIQPIVAQISDLARIAGQLDPDTGMRIASNLRFAITNSKTQAEVHTARALGQQQPGASPQPGAPTPSPAVPPPLSGAAVAAGAVPPRGQVPATPGANAAPAAPTTPVGSHPAMQNLPYRVVPGQAPPTVQNLPYRPDPNAPPPAMELLSQATPVAYARPATPAPLVQPVAGTDMYGRPLAETPQTPQGKEFKPRLEPTPGSTPPVGTKTTGGGKGTTYEKEFQKKMAAQDAAFIQEAEKNVGYLEQNEAALRLLNSKEGMPTGAGAGWRRELSKKFAQYLGWESPPGLPDEQQVANAEAYIANRLVSALRVLTQYKGQMSDREQRQAREAVAGEIDYSEIGLRNILKTERKAIMTMLDDYKRRFPDRPLREPNLELAPPGLPMIETDEEFNALPPGPFIDPEGHRRMKR